MRIPMIAASALLALTACGSSEPTPPVPASVPTSTTYSFVDPSIPNVDEPLSDTNLDSLGPIAQDRILEEVWDERDSEAQAEICSGWRIMPQTMLDAFMAQDHDDNYDRYVVQAFFDRKC